MEPYCWGLINNKAGWSLLGPTPLNVTVLKYGFYLRWQRGYQHLFKLKFGYNFFGIYIRWFKECHVLLI